MNFYNFHIGDYVKAAGHLTWEEDAALRRMLDLYYSTEARLPIDLSKLAKMIRMPESRKAIKEVLAEFFTKTPEGWMNDRCEKEIAAMRESQAEAEEKRAHERGRLKRYRDRRSAMFNALRAVDVTPPWDVSMRDLQALHDQHCNAKSGGQ